MKTTKYFILILTMSLHRLFAQENKEGEFSFPILEGPYIGQKQPSLVAEVMKRYLINA